MDNNVQRSSTQSTNSSLIDNFNRSVRDLLVLIRERRITRFEPLFERGGGFTYSSLEGYELWEQLDLLHRLEKEGFLRSDLSESILQCPHCRSTEFTVQLSCTVCDSTNVTRCAVIEHLACGNIDFEHKFIKEEHEGNLLVCGKCGKRLKAIGVDYSKPGIFYKCLDCRALLPQTQNLCTCLNCAKSSKEDQLKELQMMKYEVDSERVSRHFVTNNLLPIVAEKLHTENKIRASCPGKIRGLSKVEHSFGLLISHRESGEPILVADLLDNGRNGIDQPQDSVRILAFYAKSLDASFSTKNIIKRILVIQSELTKDAIELADAYGITVLRQDNADSLVATILEIIAGGSSKNTISDDGLPET